MLRCRADDLQSLRERSTADATRLRKRPISRRGKRVNAVESVTGLDLDGDGTVGGEVESSGGAQASAATRQS